MKILILSGAFGMGHNAVAAAIRQEINESDRTNEVSIVDLIQYIYPERSKILYNMFNLVAAKYHGAYNFINKSFEKLNPIKRIPAEAIHKVDQLMKDHEPDMIICTLPICAKIISDYKKKTGSQITMATCITDISTHKAWFNDGCDVYFVPTRSVKEKMMAKGMEEHRIYVTGIPVREEFVNPRPERALPRMAKREILIMGGGLGLLPDIDGLLKSIGGSEDNHVTIITGNNKKAYESLHGKYKDVEVVGFTDRVSDYMRRADLLISKSGGITVFEALATQTPMLVIKPFLEQEQRNARYIQRNGLGKVFWEKPSMSQIRNFIHNEVEQKRIQRNMGEAKSQTEVSVSDIVMVYKEGMSA